MLMPTSCTASATDLVAPAAPPRAPIRGGRLNSKARVAEAAPPPNMNRRRERKGASASARSDAPSLEGGLQSRGVEIGAAGAATSQAAAVAAGGWPQSACCEPPAWRVALQYDSGLPVNAERVVGCRLLLLGGTGRQGAARTADRLSPPRCSQERLTLQPCWHCLKQKRLAQPRHGCRKCGGGWRGGCLSPLKL
jgi:hypothetical protein